jgi:hypothetical protein
MHFYSLLVESRKAVLDAYLFFDLHQVSQLTADRMEEYTLRRPHDFTVKRPALKNPFSMMTRKNILSIEFINFKAARMNTAVITNFTF